MRPGYDGVSFADEDEEMRLGGRTAVIVSMHRTKGSCVR